MFNIFKKQKNLLLLGNFERGGLKSKSSEYFANECKELRKLIVKCDLTTVAQIHNYIYHKKYYENCSISIVDNTVVIQKVL